MRKAFLVLCVGAILSFVGCAPKESALENTEIITISTESSIQNLIDDSEQCILQINKKTISDKSGYLINNGKYGLIPFITIMKELGASVEIDKKHVNIHYCGQSYILDIQENQLVNESITIEDTPVNLIMKPPGSLLKAYYGLYEDEYYVDTESIAYFMEYVLCMDMVIDWQQKQIIITPKTD